MVLAIAVAALVLSLVIGVVALALAGGDADDRGEPVRPARRRVAIVATVTAFVGLGAPALVIAVNAVEGPKQAVGGVELDEAQQHGRELFARSCRNCHRLAAANTVGRVGPSLDQRLARLPDRAARLALVRDAIAEGRARGNGQMPSGLYQGADAADIADFLAVVAGR